MCNNTCMCIIYKHIYTYKILWKKYRQNHVNGLRPPNQSKGQEVSPETNRRRNMTWAPMLNLLLLYFLFQAKFQKPLTMEYKYSLKHNPPNTGHVPGSRQLFLTLLTFVQFLMTLTLGILVLSLSLSLFFSLLLSSHHLPSPTTPAMFILLYFQQLYPIWYLQPWSLTKIQ